MNAIDLTKAKEAKPEEYDNSFSKAPTFLSQAGFKLAKITLLIISGVILFAMVFIVVKQFSADSAFGELSRLPATDDATFERKLQLYKLAQEEAKNYRDFIVQFLQMILLNLLLPILTAILGYIFGTSGNTKE